MFDKYKNTQDFLYIPLFDDQYRINVNGIIIYDKGELTGQRLEQVLNSDNEPIVDINSITYLVDMLVYQ